MADCKGSVSFFATGDITVIKKKIIRKHIDLQLPQQEYYEVPVVAEPEPVVKEFKERVVDSIEGTDTAFKKRKIGAAAKRNTRRRLDDD